MTTVDTVASAVEPAIRVRFGNRPGLFALLMKNLGLTIVTLGIYRFWARAALRRYWWSTVVIDGDPLEYTGTGGELFMGFLAFLAVMTPFGILYGLVVALANSPAAKAAVVAVIYIFVLFVLVPVALFRARRYRLSRTRWRGIRGGMAGSTGRFLWIAVLGLFVTAITAGIAAPWMRLRQTRYMTNQSSFGDRAMTFDGKAAPLIMRWVVVLACGLPMVASMIYAASLKQPPAAGETHPWAGLSLIVSFVVLFLGFVWYSFYELRYILRHTSIGEVRFQSNVKPWKLAGFVFLFVGIFIFFISLFFVAVIAAFVSSKIHMAANHSFDPKQLGTIITVGLCFFAAYLVFLAVANILRILILDKAIVRNLVDTLSLENASALASIGRSTAPMPGSGEGMVDSFDIGVF